MSHALQRGLILVLYLFKPLLSGGQLLARTGGSDDSQKEVAKIGSAHLGGDFSRLLVTFLKYEISAVLMLCLLVITAVWLLMEETTKCSDMTQIRSPRN